MEARGTRRTQPPPPIALRLDVTDEHGRSQRDDPCWMELPLRDRLEALTQRGHTLQRAPRISDQVVSDRRGALTVRLIVAVTRRDQLRRQIIDPPQVRIRPLPGE